MILSRKSQVAVLGAVLFIGFGFIANPWIVKPNTLTDPVGDGLLILEGLLGLGSLTAVCLLRLRTQRDSLRAESASYPASSTTLNLGHLLTAAFLLLYIAALWITLFWDRWSNPRLAVDDYDYIAAARNWPVTFDGLLQPYNEHLCVPTRLLTWSVCALVDESHWPRALARSGMVLFALTWLPLMWFVHRETQSPALALLAVSFVALTTTHQEVVTWYSASQWCWALLLTLSSLVVLQNRDGDTHNWRLIAAASLAALGPFCYAIGALVGPIGTAYLLMRGRWNGGPLPFWRCAIPLLATVLCLSVIVPWKARGVVDRSNYMGKSITEAASMPKGVLFGVRSTTDMLVLRNLGIRHGTMLPRACYAAVFACVTMLLAELVGRGRQPVLPFLGCALVVLPYALTLPWRAWVQYTSFVVWTRYQLFPQFGVALVLCGALGTFGPGWLTEARLSIRHIVLIVVIATGQWLLHWR